MPTYEFICRSCQRRFSIFISYSEYGSTEVHCSYCGNKDIIRKIGRIRTLKGISSLESNIPDDSSLDALGQDPAAMGRMMRQMSLETGEPMPDEMNQVVNRLERGESPDEIEKSMPDLGDDSMLDI